MNFTQSGDTLTFTQDRGGESFVISPTDTVVGVSGGTSGGLSPAAAQALIDASINFDNLNHDVNLATCFDTNDW